MFACSPLRRPLRVSLVSSGVLVAMGVLGWTDRLQGGTPQELEPTLIPEEQWETPAPMLRNPRNRFGVQGGIAFGVKAEFVTEAFLGNDITVDPGFGPQDVVIDSSDGNADEDGGFTGEIYYERVLGESDLVYDGVNETWGFHIGVSYTKVELKDKVNVNAYEPLNPGTEPVFLDQSTMHHDLEADIWQLNLGLFKESYLTDRFYAKVGGGLSVAYIDGSYSLSGPYDFGSEKADETDVLVGGYLDLTLGYDFNRNWGLYTGIRYQYLSSFEIETSSSEARLEFDQSFLAFIGLRFSF